MLQSIGHLGCVRPPTPDGNAQQHDRRKERCIPQRVVDDPGHRFGIGEQAVKEWSDDPQQADEERRYVSPRDGGRVERHRERHGGDEAWVVQVVVDREKERGPEEDSQRPAVATEEKGRHQQPEPVRQCIGFARPRLRRSGDRDRDRCPDNNDENNVEGYWWDTIHACSQPGTAIGSGLRRACQ